MFEVVCKSSKKVYKVYNVLRKLGSLWFLIYEDDNWEYCKSTRFEPYNEVY